MEYESLMLKPAFSNLLTFTYKRDPVTMFPSSGCLRVFTRVLSLISFLLNWNQREFTQRFQSSTRSLNESEVIVFLNLQLIVPWERERERSVRLLLFGNRNREPPIWHLLKTFLVKSFEVSFSLFFRKSQLGKWLFVLLCRLVLC